MGKSKEVDATPEYVAEEAGAVGVGEVVNASGHKQELDRNFSLLSICAVGICTGNTWAALGGSIVSCKSSFSELEASRRDLIRR
jgi:hypothetical protein